MARTVTSPHTSHPGGNGHPIPRLASASASGKMSTTGQPSPNNAKVLTYKVTFSETVFGVKPLATTNFQLVSLAINLH